MSTVDVATQVSWPPRVSRDRRRHLSPYVNSIPLQDRFELDHDVCLLVEVMFVLGMAIFLYLAVYSLAVHYADIIESTCSADNKWRT